MNNVNSVQKNKLPNTYHLLLSGFIQLRKLLLVEEPSRPSRLLQSSESNARSFHEGRCRLLQAIRFA